MERAAELADRILTVDGDVLVRHAISDYLRSCGYEVVEASSTDEAALVLGEPVTLSAILCDTKAPGSRTPFELRALAAARQPPVRLILAGSPRSAADHAATLCDEGPELTRPYDPQGVVDYIRRLTGAAEGAARQA